MDYAFQPAREDPAVEPGSRDATCREVVRRVLRTLADKAYVSADDHALQFGAVDVRLAITAYPDEDVGGTTKKKARAVLHLPGENGAWTPVHYHVYCDYVDP
ncbi:MAG: hypothetical protein ACYTGN_14975 [Planctomycetota bacterium]|jgi:hypothetical protein